MISLRFDMRLGAVEARSAYAAALDMVAWAEEPLAPFVVLSEHHGIEGGYLSSPGPMAAAMAARTTSTFVMVAATVLPLHDPVRLAEEISVIDHLSGGRVGWVFAVGYRPEEFALFGVEYADRGRLMDEKLAVVLDALADLDPRPALFVGGGGPRAARRAARSGLGLFAQTDVGELGELYAQACAEAGVEPGPCVLPAPDMPLSVFVADDIDAAWDEIGPYLLANAIDYAAWNDRSTTTASLSTATTVAELRAEAGAYRIVTVDEARALATEGSLNLHPMCGGIPPELAWPYLRRAAGAV